MKRLLTLGLTVLLCASAGAQVFYQNTMYTYNRFAYNPAAAGLPMPGMSSGSSLTLMARNQWLGIDGAPRTAVLSFNTFLGEGYRSGLGALATVDQVGPLSSVRIEAAYAFRFDLKFAYLSIGVNGGLRNNVIDGQWIYNQDGGIDPVVPLGIRSQVVPALGAGVYLSGGGEQRDKYFVGLSGQDLLEPSIENLLQTFGVGGTSRIPRSFFLMGGYRFDIGASGRSSLTPMAFLRTDGVRPPQADVSLYWNYKPLVVGANYRFFNDSFSGIFGFQVSDRTFFGYSYDYTLSALNAQGDLQTHELILSYTFPGNSNAPGKKHDILRNPDGL
ncbi:MAG: type IX secretion system membrane protein PorP/SprF [Bacteroidia bacterium]|nr:type IX secretion system membrane protein PorP/SprF [Bacteroidia bacterium]